MEAGHRPMPLKVTHSLSASCLPREEELPLQRISAIGMRGVQVIIHRPNAPSENMDQKQPFSFGLFTSATLSQQ